MAVKLADTLAPMGDFEIAEAKDISVNIGGTKKMLQKAIEDGDIGGASDIVVKCTEDQYGALLPDQKALNIIYCTEKKLYYHDETIAPVVDTTPITDSIGDLDSLSTTDKTSLVAAINETNANLGEISDSLVDIDADNVNITKEDDTKKSLQAMYEDGELGGGGGVDYSTEEVDTGVKWIDGKPIYRRVFIGSWTAKANAWTSTNISTVGFETLVSVSCKRDAKEGNLSFVQVEMDNTLLNLAASTGTHTIKQIILEYTKQ